MLLATYPSSHAALKAEKRLHAAGLTVELIPTPRQIRSSCGFCLLIDLEQADDALRESLPEGLWRAFDPAPGTYRRTYEPLP